MKHRPSITGFYIHRYNYGSEMYITSSKLDMYMLCLAFLDMSIGFAWHYHLGRIQYRGGGSRW